MTDSIKIQGILADDPEAVLIEYKGNTGKHYVPSYTKALQQKYAVQSYGYFCHSAQFYVLAKDAKAKPHLFFPVEVEDGSESDSAEEAKSAEEKASGESGAVVVGSTPDVGNAEESASASVGSVESSSEGADSGDTKKPKKAARKTTSKRGKRKSTKK